MVAPVTAVLGFQVIKKHEACRIGSARTLELGPYLDHTEQPVGATRYGLEHRGLQLADSHGGRVDSFFSYAKSRFDSRTS